VLCLGRDGGVPVLTVTSPRPMAETEPAAPARDYLRTMIDGLHASHRLRDDAIVTYLAAVPGCSEELVASALE
jgi:hypothetical protein